MDPQRAAWVAAGSPTPGPGTPGSCARCAMRGPVHAGTVPAGAAGLEGWAHPGRDGLCAACWWGRSTPELRRDAWEVTADRHLERLERPALRERLRRPVPAEVALAVVLRPRRKHCLPAAQWGRVAVDDVPVPWTAREVELYELVLQLREHGFGPRQLLARAPAFEVLRRVPADQWGTVQEAWERLRGWREPVTPWMTLALHATDTRRTS